MGVDTVGWSKTGVGFSALKEMVGRVRISHPSPPIPSQARREGTRRGTPLEHYKRCLSTARKAPLLFDLPWVKYNYKAETETDGQITAEEKDFIKAV